FDSFLDRYRRELNNSSCSIFDLAINFAHFEVDPHQKPVVRCQEQMAMRRAPAAGPLRAAITKERSHAIDPCSFYCRVCCKPRHDNPGLCPTAATATTTRRTTTGTTNNRCWDADVTDPQELQRLRRSRNGAGLDPVRSV